jgi:hypothetical protein
VLAATPFPSLGFPCKAHVSIWAYSFEVRRPHLRRKSRPLAPRVNGGRGRGGCKNNAYSFDRCSAVYLLRTIPHGDHDRGGKPTELDKTQSPGRQPGLAVWTAHGAGGLGNGWSKEGNSSDFRKGQSSPTPAPQLRCSAKNTGQSRWASASTLGLEFSPPAWRWSLRSWRCPVAHTVAFGPRPALPPHHHRIAPPRRPEFGGAPDLVLAGAKSARGTQSLPIFRG